jgi:hypothetical protein
MVRMLRRIKLVLENVVSEDVLCKTLSKSPPVTMYIRSQRSARLAGGSRDPDDRSVVL